MGDSQAFRFSTANVVQKQTTTNENDDNNEDTDSEDDPDPHFEPLMHLPEVDVKTLEEEEDVLWEHRAQLYRYDDSEWKQRGTGVVKLLKHKELGYVRLLMRRDVTLKVCANHYILPIMELRPHDKSDRALVWCALADFADEEPKKETLAIRFKDTHLCQEFRKHFELAKTLMRAYQKMMTGGGDSNEKHKVNNKEQAEGEPDAKITKIESKDVKEKGDEEEKKLAKEIEGLSVA